MDKLFVAAGKLPIIGGDGVGDCIETDVCPEIIRTYSEHYRFIIRQIDDKTWWIWRRK